jgi:hypothetical protein
MTAKKLDGFAQGQQIKRVLRHRSSKTYFKDGAWTRNAEEADSFEDLEKVAEACVRYGLSDVEVALQFGPTGCDVFCTPIR